MGIMSEENLKIRIKFEDFPITCRICLGINICQPFSSNIFELYKRILNISEVNGCYFENIFSIM